MSMETTHPTLRRKPKSKRVTLQDVARRSGFSPSTVSIVLSEAPLSRYVSAATKELIRETAQSFGYRPDIFARSLRSRRSDTIGVLVFDISDPFCVLILRGIEKAMHGTRFMPILMDAHNERRQFRGYVDLLMERRVEGMIVVANWLFDEGGLLEKASREAMPTMVVGRDLSEQSIGSVIVDNEAGGYEAIKHLYELGHRQIALIRGPEKMLDSERRWKGIERFARESGWKIDPRRVRQLPYAVDALSGFECGAQLTTELLQSRLKFTALLAFDDLTALGAVRALSKVGRTAPRDCSIVGFDDVPLAALSTPGLTTVRQPMEKMGAVAARRVLEALRDDKQLDSHREMLPPALVVRDSTARLR
jgi:LacI family transcriptional regulator